MKRYTSHDTTVSGPHVWDQDLEVAALFPTMTEADKACTLLNAGGMSRDLLVWQN